MNSLASQTAWVFLQALPVACIAWTWTQEEIFREAQEAFKDLTKDETRSQFTRKLAFGMTCEYCFSHWIAAIIIAITQFKFLVPGLWGYVLAWFSIAWIANVYMSLFRRLRLDIKEAKQDTDSK